MGKSKILNRILGVIGIPTIVPCNSYAQYVNEVPKLLSIAKKNIIMTTGLFPKFYGEKKIKDAFEKTIKKGVNVDIIIDKEGQNNLSEPGLEWLKNLNEDKEKKIRIYVSEETVSPHIIVVDNKHIREETPHEANVEKTNNNIIYYAGLRADFNRVALIFKRNKSKLYEERDKKERNNQNA